ncbi:MAG TPA: hypothetical protein PKE65_07440, partial [Rhizobiaceae bacterium]|nr:hypothetical protein [Rhizobiaceae bacterium]
MPYGSHAFFAANNRTIGNELYRVDPDFTVHLAADVAPDPGESSSPQQMFEYMGELYFRAAFGLPGAELYKLNVDGVAELVFDATPSGGTGPSAFLPFLGSVFFRGSDGTGQRIFELGQDGDVAQISNLNPSGHDINSGLFQFGTALYFAGDNGTTGLDLYRMNADKSIELVDVIRPGTDSALISGFFIHNNALYFAADNGVNGRELWKLPAGGTDAQMVADFMPGADSSDPLVRVQVGDTPYLWAKLDPAIGRELYRLNPDDTMTLVRDSNPGPGDATIGLMFEVGGDYYFRNNTVAEGREIWRLTAAGDLELVGDFNPGPGDGPDILGVFNDELYLRFSDPVFGTEPFKLKADDTLQLIADVEPGIDSSNPSDFIVYNGSAILELNETINGQEVWRIDSNANTTRLSDIEPGDGNSNPRSMTVLNVAVGDGPDTPTNGDNNFVGTDLNDTIGLLDGNDVYAGMDGNDVVIGGAGFDTLIGLRGNDTLDGGTNPASQGDFLLGGPGDDTYFVDSALDFVDEGIVFGGA